MKNPIQCAPHWTKEHTLKVKRSMNHLLWEWANYGSSELPAEVRQHVRDLINAVNRMEASQ